MSDTIDDAEGARLPAGLPPVVDAHVHLFPPRLFEAVWRWFDAHAWPVRYKLYSERVLEFLFSRGVERVVALHYAHKPGMARALNDAMVELCRGEPRLVGTATVLPGEPDAEAIVADAFAAGLKGVKLHCHVQCVAADAPSMHAIYDIAERAGRPVVVHAGRQPANPHYKCDVLALCSVNRVERVLEAHPKLELVVPHLGFDEFDAYERLLERYDNLWLDTAMVVGGYFPHAIPRRLLDCRPERVMYGTDFPNLPYAWDREVRALAELGLTEARLAALLGGNALALYG